VEGGEGLLAGIDAAAGELHLLGIRAALVDAEQAAVAADKQPIDADAVAIGAARDPRFADAFHRRWMA
jgi:hypothetical protein